MQRVARFCQRELILVFYGYEKNDGQPLELHPKRFRF